MRQLSLITALGVSLISALVSACDASPVATAPVATSPPVATAPLTTADSAAAHTAAPAASAQPVPFVGKPGLKAVLRSGGLAPSAGTAH